MMLLLLALKATVVLALAAVAAWPARWTSAAHRHAIWLAALTAIVVLPAGTALVPRWDVIPVPDSAVAPPAATAITLTVTPSTPALPWQETAGVLWLAGAVFVLFRAAAGAWQAGRIVRRGQPAPWAGECLAACLSELGFGGPVRLVESAGTAMPFSWGSSIVLPAALRNAPLGRLRAVLLHEIAHIERGDTASQWLAHLATAMYWFHPLAWLALSRTRREREHACDDRVLELSERPSVYAAELMEVARSAAHHNRPVVAPAMAEKSELEERVMAILDAGKRRGRLSRLSLGVIVAGVAVLVLPLAATQAIGGGTGSISGIVRDPSGAPVKNARINVTAPAVGGSATVATDAAGHWQLAQLPAGAFTVEVLAPGFRRLKETVTVENARETTRNVTLMLGSVREEITITTGNAPKPPAPPPAPDAAAPRTPPAPPAVPAPPAAPAPPGAVTPVQLIKQVTPAYPESAKAEKAAGQVVLRGVISVDGNVIGLTTISSDRPDLEEAARTAVQQWKYAPAKLNGVPVEVVTDITIKFRPE